MNQCRNILLIPPSHILVYGNDTTTPLNSTPEYLLSTDGILALAAENLTVWEYLESELGPQHIDLRDVIPLTFLYLLIFVSGLLGNIAVCIVIVRHQTMHTATNYYLFNLAISDLMLLTFGLPNDLSTYWHQYPWMLGKGFCKLRALISEMSSYVSVLTIVSFSTERYLSICYPLYLYTMSGLQRAVRIIAVLWLVAFSAALPFSLYTDIYYICDLNQINIPESAYCGMLSAPTGLAEFSFLAFFIIPMLIIAAQYTMMAQKISRRTTSHSLGRCVAGSGSVHRDHSRNSQSHRVIIRMLVAVVICFFICWAPFHLQRLLYNYVQENPYFDYVFHITGILYYLSSTVNPILYNVMSMKYRTAFREILCGGKRGGERNRARAKQCFKDGLMRHSSTYRKTGLLNSRSHSHSDPAKSEQDEQDQFNIVYRCNNKGDTGENHLMEMETEIDDFDTGTLVSTTEVKLMKINTPNGKNAVFYELNFKPNNEHNYYFDVSKPNTETCI